MSTTEQTPDAETSKGYWTENSPGYLDIAVIVKSTGNNDNDGEKIRSIVLSSGYWYRTQCFEVEDAWGHVKTLLRECGRKLPMTPDQEYVYRLGNLSAQQVNQMYYLLKHKLTSGKIPFTISHSLSIDVTNTEKMPTSKAHRRLRRNKNRQIVENNVWKNI